jgi:23S rRNA (cytosine1962-C5)-methyltransferase
MLFETSKNFSDFKLLDSGRGYRLEQWGPYRLARPDPQAIWKRHLSEEEWKKADAIFDGKWRTKKRIPEPWAIHYNLPLRRGESKTGEWNLRLGARLTSFKHTGVFAEQAANWDWLAVQVGHIKKELPKQELKVLNLFGYTGAATALLSKLGCFVTHVDASKPAIGWAKENHTANKLPQDSVRWILDDAVKFVKRELKRGASYHGIIMDPPAFGHSPTGKTWKFAEDLPELLEDVAHLLSAEGQFLLVNAYATNSSPLALENMIQDALTAPVLPTRNSAKGGVLESGEICLTQQDGRLISTGIASRWHS